MGLGRAKSYYRIGKGGGHVLPPPSPFSIVVEGEDSGGGGGVKAMKKKAAGPRLWMRLDRLGQSEVIECDKSLIIKRVAIPSRDLRILGPIFAHSSSILAREKAMLVNLEFIRAIVTADEVLLLNPLSQEVLPFVEQLRQVLPRNRPPAINEAGQSLPALESIESEQDELPFEFQVLEIALEVVCTYLSTSVAKLECEAYPLLDELAIKVSTKNLEHVRSLKSDLTWLLARVQKVRDELEHLLDDNEDMAQLYLTRKWILQQQSEVLLGASASNSITPAASHLRRLGSARSGRSGTMVTNYFTDHNVEDLEMLLEAYFTQLDGTRNKILSVREYIDDTEDYVNIQLDSQRNELIQLQLVLTNASFCINVGTLIASIFGMNIPFTWNNVDGIFWIVVWFFTAACVLLFFLIHGYARWKKLLGS